MKIRLPWRKDTAEKYNKLESLLVSTLKPVALRREFITQLRTEMVGEKKANPLSLVSPKTLRMGIIGVGAALSGAFIMIAGVRWLVSLLGALGLLHMQRKQSKENQSLPPQAAI